MMVRTPATRWTVLAAAAALFLTAPVVVAGYYVVELELGVYPPDGDTISIPILNYVVLWIATAPLTWWVIWLCLRRYPGRVSLMVWNRQRRVWSAVWSGFFGLAAVAFLVVAPWPISGDHPTFIAHSLLDVWLLLVLRAGIVAQPGRHDAAEPAPSGGTPQGAAER